MAKTRLVVEIEGFLNKPYLYCKERTSCLSPEKCKYYKVCDRLFSCGCMRNVFAIFYGHVTGTRELPSISYLEAYFLLSENEENERYHEYCYKYLSLVRRAKRSKNVCQWLKGLALLDTLEAS